MLDAGRAAVAALTGMPDAEVVFTTGSQHALDLLLPVGRPAAERWPASPANTVPTWR